MKVPIAKEKAVFYYYKRYSGTEEGKSGGGDDQLIVSLPTDRTIQLCHFVKPIDENTVQKFFGLAGKIKQIQIGEYKNKANNKRKRRTVYFALVVYKKVEDCKVVLNDPKFLQGKVNKLMKKSVKFSSNPFAAEEDDVSEKESENEDDKVTAEHNAKMEEGGFIMVKPETLGSKKGRGSDGVNTVQGISQEEAQEYLER